MAQIIQTKNETITINPTISLSKSLEELLELKKSVELYSVTGDVNYILNFRKNPKFQTLSINSTIFLDTNLISLEQEKEFYKSQQIIFEQTIIELKKMNLNVKLTDNGIVMPSNGIIRSSGSLFSYNSNEYNMPTNLKEFDLIRKLFRTEIAYGLITTTTLYDIIQKVMFGKTEEKRKDALVLVQKDFKVYRKLNQLFLNPIVTKQINEGYDLMSDYMQIGDELLLGKQTPYTIN